MAPKICIIGAGPGGLTLAALLKSTPYTFLERERFFLERDQGGTLDIHPDSGQVAMAEIGLLPTLLAQARPGNEALIIADKTGAVKFYDGEAGGFKPEIDRGELRRMLLGAVGEERVRWGRKVTGVKDKGEGYVVRHESVDGGDEVEEEYDVVVGADGAWSKVRELLTDVTPYYSGISCVEVRWKELDGEFAKKLGEGSCFALGDGRGVFVQKNGDGSTRVYFMFQCGEEWIDSVPVDIPTAHLEGWGEHLRGLLKTEERVVRRLYMLPVGLRWEGKKNIAILGDAAHLMTPFAGVGVNLAMLDALELSRAILGTTDTLSERLRKYEKDMLERAEGEARKTWHGLEMCFAADAPREMAEFMKNMYEKGRQQAKVSG